MVLSCRELASLPAAAGRLAVTLHRPRRCRSRRCRPAATATPSPPPLSPPPSSPPLQSCRHCRLPSRSHLLAWTPLQWLLGLASPPPPTTYSGRPCPHHWPLGSPRSRPFRRLCHLYVRLPIVACALHVLAALCAHSFLICVWFWDALAASAKCHSRACRFAGFRLCRSDTLPLCMSVSVFVCVLLCALVLVHVLHF